MPRECSSTRPRLARLETRPVRSDFLRPTLSPPTTQKMEAPCVANSKLGKDIARSMRASHRRAEPWDSVLDQLSDARHQPWQRRVRAQSRTRRTARAQAERRAHLPSRPLPASQGTLSAPCLVAAATPLSPGPPSRRTCRPPLGGARRQQRAGARPAHAIATRQAAAAKRGRESEARTHIAAVATTPRAEAAAATGLRALERTAPVEVVVRRPALRPPRATSASRARAETARPGLAGRVGQDRRGLGGRRAPAAGARELEDSLLHMLPRPRHRPLHLLHPSQPALLARRSPVCGVR